MWSLAPGSWKGVGSVLRVQGQPRTEGGNRQCSSLDFLGEMAKEAGKVQRQAGA